MPENDLGPAVRADGSTYLKCEQVESCISLASTVAQSVNTATERIFLCRNTQNGCDADPACCVTVSR